MLRLGYLISPIYFEGPIWEVRVKPLECGSWDALSDRRIWWLTVSKAADRSSNISNEDLEAIFASLRSSTTESKAVTVECPLLKPDWLLIFNIMLSNSYSWVIHLINIHNCSYIPGSCYILFSANCNSETLEFLCIGAQPRSFSYLAPSLCLILRIWDATVYAMSREVTVTVKVWKWSTN